MHDTPRLMYVIPSLIFCMQCSIYLCQLSCYKSILMYIVSSFVCDVLMISSHAMSISPFCMIIHMLYTKISIIVASLFIQAVPRFLFCIVFSHSCCINTNLCCINTTNLCCIKICQQFDFFYYPYSEKLSSPAVACGPTTLQDLEIRRFGKNDSQVGSPPSVGTRETLGGHLHFIWDTPESLVFHSNYTCHSLVPFSFTLISLAGHLISKVSSECFITDLSGLEGQLLQSICIVACFLQRLYLFWSL